VPRCTFTAHLSEPGERKTRALTRKKTKSGEKVDSLFDKFKEGGVCKINFHDKSRKLVFSRV